MTAPATPGRLAVRLAICQACGIVLGVLAGGAIGRLYGAHRGHAFGSYAADFAAITVTALAISIPFYGVAFAVLSGFTESILRRPFMWSVGIPLLALLAALYVFPPWEIEGLHWITLIPLSASSAGLMFCLWQAISPLNYVG